MKINYIYRILIVILLCNSISPAFSQQMYKGQVNITNAEAKQQANSVLVSMQMDLSSLRIDNQRMLTLTPVLATPDNRVELPAIVVNGSARQKAYIRSVALDKQHSGDYPLHVLQSVKDTKEPLNYNQVIAFEPWMNNASLYLKEDICGCGGYNEQSAENRVVGITTVAPEVQERPKPAEIIAVSKGRTETQTITVYFPVGISVIKEDYNNNSAQFEQMDNLINELKSNKNINITAIEIEGYASPEGGVRRNEQLSEQRVQALKQYLLENIDLPTDKYNITYGGENWDDLLTLLENSSIDHKEEIISIIKNTEDVAQRKRKLETLAGGRPYALMLRDFYPQLRKAICNIRIHYTVLP
ncbi:OmpA family protein [Dysgonomonas alginatilytica]|uniref:OmpA family protein n=1 Tax=Dysgonomonas alginatilytica TaxID=1605892 RepID=A0A2V3PK29_9BACT|nr:DUF3868 domain-containing protein [Dysgonomonas alginatilytica]PXV59269.1 OmpA family protein [Dysgonomonas alginatilytica]